MNRDFNKWLNEFKVSISDYSYYVDFDKIYRNVDKIKVELNILNSLIGSRNIEEEFKNIFVDCELTSDKIVLKSNLKKTLDFVKQNYGFDILKEIRSTTKKLIKGLVFF